MIQVPMLEDLQLSGQQEGTPQAQSLEDALNAAMKSSVDTFSDCICPPASRQGDSLCRITVVEVPPAVLTLHLMRFGYDDNGRSTKFQNKVKHSPVPCCCYSLLPSRCLSTDFTGTLSI